MKKAIIIGAGIAGLSAGILARQNGFEAELFEMHALPGGLCAAWRRGAYTFDGCIRYVYGSGEGNLCSALMRRIGAAGEREYMHHEETIRIETGSGNTVIFYCDLGRLQEHLLQISPEDGRQIRKLIGEAKSVGKASLPTGNPTTISEFMNAMLFFIPHVIGNGKTSLSMFASGLKSADLKEAFLKYYGYAKLDDLPLLFLIMDMAQHHVKNAGWPRGGSLALATDIEKRFLSLGGRINYGCKVDRILISGDKAAGIRLSDGREFMADCIISTADAHYTLETMLEDKFTPPGYREAFLHEKPVTPLVQVSLGVAMDLGGMPHNLAVPLKEPVTAAGIAHDTLSFKHYCYDKTMAPEGKSAVVAMLESDYDAWAELYRDPERYKAEKKHVAAQVIARLDERVPGLEKAVEACDVATPLTWRRYTGNFMGSPQGWQTAIGHMGNFPGKLPGLKNFYMTGQWVQRGGGIPGVAMAAYATVKQLCKDCGQRFK